jgi:hypothetical protein
VKVDPPQQRALSTCRLCGFPRSQHLSFWDFCSLLSCIGHLLTLSFHVLQAVGGRQGVGFFLSLQRRQAQGGL